MKFAMFLLLSAVLISPSFAQVTARRAVQPLTKQGVLPPPPSTKIPAPVPPAAVATTPAAARSAAQAPAIDPTLKPSPVSLLGKVDGLAGTLYVTNTGAKPVAPFVQLAVVDKSGRAVGYVTNSAPAIGPNKAEKIQVLATNTGAVDFKVVRLTGRK